MVDVVVRHSKFALYLDTSALVKLFIEEDGSAGVRMLAAGRLAAEVLLVSSLGYTEASVSLARMVHRGRISAAELPHHLGGLNDYWEESIQQVELTDGVLRDARQLAERFPLRTYDAIHLASAREAERMLRGVFKGEVRFLAFDAALLKAAQAVGFTIPRSHI